MKVVTNFHKCEEAYLFKAFLESEGIEAHIFDEFTPQNSMAVDYRCFWNKSRCS